LTWLEGDFKIVMESKIAVNIEDKRIVTITNIQGGSGRLQSVGVKWSHMESAVSPFVPIL
jgi:hypothetical protein